MLKLCDDSFEEHVIATPPYWTGLHLHGLNHNTPQFLTAPPSEVDAFASYFGFIPTKYVELQTLNEVKAFTDDVANTGSWEGDQIEGFVVRCTVRAGDNSTSEARPPYHPGAPFFFKIKFEEPYLLYRQWREITRLMLPLLNSPSPKEESAVWQKVRSKAKRPEVKVYADWCGRIMKVDPESFEDYDRGVVKVRDKFLEWIDEEGATAWSDARTGKGNAIQFHHGKGTRRRAGRPQKWILIPIAVPGCGKPNSLGSLRYTDVSTQERPSSALLSHSSSASDIHKPMM